MQTFTFPSGTTVELPDGMPLCQTPDAVTYDCMRVVSVGQTPSGRKVFSSHSCAAYSRAADIWSQREDIAQRERGLATATRKGRRTGHLTDALDHHRRILARMEAEYASDPAPCTCGNCPPLTERNCSWPPPCTASPPAPPPTS